MVTDGFDQEFDLPALALVLGTGGGIFVAWHYGGDWVQVHGCWWLFGDIGREYEQSWLAIHEGDEG